MSDHQVAVYDESRFPGKKWSKDQLEKINELKLRVIDGIYEGSFISEVCQELELTQATVRNWRKMDPDFNEAFQEAESAYVDTIEKEAIRRAVKGVNNPVVSAGRVVMDPNNPNEPLMQRVYSDPLMMFILKGKRREVYGDSSKIDQTVTLNVTGIRDELARRLASRGTTS
jgi:hypothetical protein